MTDSKLVEGAQRGDRVAFDTLARSVVGRLSTVARLMVADADVADDAVQETLVVAWRDLRGLRDVERFDAWVDRILVRKVYREARRERRQRVISVDPRSAAEPTSSIGRPTDIDDRDLVQRALLRLKPDHRAALVLHHYLGLDGPQMAVALGIPPTTARSRLMRATDALRAELDADARVGANLRTEPLA